MNGQVITVMGKHDYTTYQETAIPYIGKEGEEDLGRQKFEEVDMIDDKDKHIGTFRLSYVPTQAEIVEMKKKARRREVDKTYDPAIKIPHIWSSFPRASYVQKSEITKEAIPGDPEVEKLNKWFTVPYKNYESLE